MSTKADLKYVPGLDSLRGLACLAVIFYHANIVTKSSSPFVPFKGGFLGVDLFFVLSGFLITSILLGQYERDATINFKNFYIKRVLRLYPPILISIVVFIVPVLFTSKMDALSNIVSLMTYTGDCFMLVQHFFSLPYPLMSGHSWSLAVEEQFYLTYPFLLLLALRFFSRKKQGSLISFFPIFWLLYFGIVMASSILLGAWFYKFFLWRFFEVYLGCFIAMIYSSGYANVNRDTAFSSKVKEFVKRVYANKAALYISIAFMVWLVVFPNLFPMVNYLTTYNIHYILFTLASSILIINIVYPRPSLYTRTLQSKILIWFGKISYGLYLYAPFVTEKTREWFFQGNPFRSTQMMLTADVISVTASILFAYLSYVLIEKNILRLKHRFDRPKKQTQARHAEVALGQP